MRWTDDIKSLTGLSVNYFSERQAKVVLIREQHIQEEETDPCLIQGNDNGTPLL